MIEYDKEELSVIVFEKFFSVEVPKGWEFDEEEGVISFFKDGGGVGALQVSFLKSDVVEVESGEEVMQNAAEIIDDMKTLTMGFAENLGIDVDEQDIEVLTIDKFPCTYFSCDDGETFWKVWAIKGENKIAPVMYCCDSINKDSDEPKIIDFIVNTFKWEFDNGDYDNDEDNNVRGKRAEDKIIN